MRSGQGGSGRGQAEAGLLTRWIFTEYAFVLNLKYYKQYFVSVSTVNVPLTHFNGLGRLSESFCKLEAEHECEYNMPCALTADDVNQDIPNNPRNRKTV